MRLLCALSVVVLLSMGCSEPHPGFTRIDEGLYFKIRRFTDDSLKPEPGDMVRLQMEFDHDPGLISDKAFLLPYDTAQSGLQSRLGRFHIGDSISLIIDSARMMGEFGIVAKDEQLTYHAEMLIVDVIKRADWERDRKIERDLHLDLQETAIEQFFKSREEEFMLQKGIYVLRDSLFVGQPVQRDVQLYLYYVARTLEGKVVDLHITPDDFIAYQLGMKGQIIAGLERIIPTMKYGESIELVIPFDLAFGPKGVPEGGVPAFTPLHYELKVSNKRNSEEQFHVILEGES